jgi:hypothetical protein
MVATNPVQLTMTVLSLILRLIQSLPSFPIARDFWAIAEFELVFVATFYRTYCSAHYLGIKSTPIFANYF